MRYTAVVKCHVSSHLPNWCSSLHRGFIIVSTKITSYKLIVIKISHNMKNAKIIVSLYYVRLRIRHGSWEMGEDFRMM